MTVTDSARDRLILPLDFPDRAAAGVMIDRLADSVTTYKIGYELIYGGGLDLVHELVDAGKRVFLDAKLLDIGNTVERATANIARMGVTYLTVHGHDRKTMRAAVAGRGDSALILLANAVMTNLTQDDLGEQGIEIALNDLVVHRARMAAEVGFNGVVPSAHEAALIREAVGPDLLIVTPGIRPEGSDAKDQARIMTPGRAIANGATHLVIGRPITQAEDPKHAADRVVAEIEAALGG